MGGSQSADEKPAESPAQAPVETQKAPAPVSTAPTSSPPAPAPAQVASTPAPTPVAPATPAVPAATPAAKDTAQAAPKAKPAAKPPSPTKVSGVPQEPGLVSGDPASKAKGKKGAAEKGSKGKAVDKGAGKGKKGKDSGVQLCVRNLAKDCTTDQLKSLFQSFGELTSVDVKMNQDNTCKGFGFVTFTNGSDANKAIAEMDNKSFAGKTLVVVLSDRQQGMTKMDREADAKGKGKGKDGGKDGKAGVKGAKGKDVVQGKGTPAPASPSASAAYRNDLYPYGYGYTMQQLAYTQQQANYSPQAAQAMQLMQAQLLQQAQLQALQAQAFYSGLAGQAAPAAAGGPPPPPPTTPGMDASARVAAGAPAAAPPAAPARPAGMATGEKIYDGNLKSISAKNGYGFITCEQTKELYKRDVFVDSADLPEGIKVGDDVNFGVTLSEKGHPRATIVQRAGQLAAR